MYQHITYRGFPYAPYQELDASLRERFEPGDVIIHSNKLSLLSAVYFDPFLPQVFVADPPSSSIDTLAPATQEVLGLTSKKDITSAVASAHRVWFIIFDQSIQEYVKVGEPMHPHLAWLNANYSLVEVQNWGNLRVYVFSEKP
jgi:hypothetical protein